jgi:hypothetical protein
VVSGPCDASYHDFDACDENPGERSFDLCLDIFCQPAVTVDPGDGAFHPPSPGQEKEALCGVASADNVECPFAHLCQCFLEFLTGIAPVGKDVPQRNLPRAGHVSPDREAQTTQSVTPGWHQTGGRLKVPDTISILHLPPYCAELNPVENIWRYLRQNFLSNRIFNNYNEIVDACCSAWNSLTAQTGKIRRIASRYWATVMIQGDWNYSNRRALEPMFSDFKSRGFGVETTRIQNVVLCQRFALHRRLILDALPLPPLWKRKTDGW